MAHSLHIPLEKNFDCQRLLCEPGCTYSSWLRKKSFWNKRQLFKWPQVYVVICEGCMYYFRNETAKHPSGSFSLYGYNKVARAAEITPNEAPWAFEIVHTHREFKTYLFSASSEQEMKDWMKRIKREMKWANNSNLRTSGDGKEADDDNISETYQQIETKIYEDATEFLIPENYNTRRDNDFTDDDDLYSQRAPAAPPVPPRESDKKAKKGLTQEMKQVTQQLEEQLKVKDKAGAEQNRLTRGAPEGSSVKKEHVKEEPQQVVQENPEEMDPGEYWGSIFFEGSEQDKAQEIIRTLAEDGVYLVRDTQRSADEKVLVAYVDQLPRKFKLLHKDEEYYLASKTSQKGRSIAELVNYYYDNPLPGYKVYLTTPYKLHPMFKPSML